MNYKVSNKINDNTSFGSVVTELIHTKPSYGASPAERSFSDVTKVLKESYPGTMTLLKVHPTKLYPNFIGKIDAPFSWAVEKRTAFDQKVKQILEGIEIFKGKVTLEPNDEITGLSQAVDSVRNLDLNA